MISKMLLIFINIRVNKINTSRAITVYNYCYLQLLRWVNLLELMVTGVKRCVCSREMCMKRNALHTDSIVLLL